MPALASYKQWLASAPSDVAIIDLIDIAHPNWGNFRMARWAHPITVTEESGSAFEYQAGYFEIDQVSMNGTTEQRTMARISSLDGALYDLLMAMTSDERETPITVTYRLVRSDDFTALLVNPPASYYAHAIEVSYSVISAELRAEPLRQRAVGKVYTRRFFPVLVYV